MQASFLRMSSKKQNRFNYRQILDKYRGQIHEVAMHGQCSAVADESEVQASMTVHAEH